MALYTLHIYKAHLVVEAVLGAAILVLALLTFISRRRQQRHERRKGGAKWLYVAMVLYALGFFFGAAEFGLRVRRPTATETSRERTRQTINLARVAGFAYFFRKFGDCAALCCIAGFTAAAAGSISYTKSQKAGSSRSKHGSGSGRVSYLVVVALSLVVAVLAVTVFAGAQWLDSQSLRLSGGWSPAPPELERILRLNRDFNRISAALRIILLAVAVYVAVWVVSAAAAARRGVASGGFRERAWSLLVAASLLNVVVHAWSMLSVAWSLDQQPRDSNWFYVAELVLDRFLTVVVLGLLYGVAKKRTATALAPDGSLTREEGKVTHQPYSGQQQYAR